MNITSLFIKITAVFAAVACALSPSYGPRERCSTPLVRKEWRNLTNTQRFNYIKAVQCLMHKPAKLSSIYPAATSRFEDFAITHQVFTPQVHWTPQFLPWHRYFLHEFEKAIRSDCSWTGGLPYWDPIRDTANLTESPIFDPVFGFGGNGAYNPNATQFFGSKGCITSGPFKDTKIHLGFGNDTAYNPGRCITRNIQTFTTKWLNPRHQELTLQQPTYEEFQGFIEGAGNISLNSGIHGGGHLTVGGDMLNVWTSPVDPIFTLHHGNIDRLWAMWQALAPRQRQFEISGRLAPRRPIPGSPNLPVAPVGNITLDYELTLDASNGNAKIKVAQVMDILGSSPRGMPVGILCNRYE
ncbi:Di-copper centre-containing protein [Wilcoxina mikolae CBS 423.85]|nr:Di-copper centre-containing protein [Wilcoxina mikolae CBS 423.85]